MNIYVGNLPYQIEEDELKEKFAAYGTVESFKIIKDKFSNKSKGYGFVEMLDNSEAEAAINALNGAEMGGRNIRVNESKPKQTRQNGGRFYNQKRY